MQKMWCKTPWFGLGALSSHSMAVARFVGGCFRSRPIGASASCPDDSTFRAHSVQVLALAADGSIGRIDVFMGPGVFTRFGLPLALEA
jgi:hypothetical protein